VYCYDHMLLWRPEDAIRIEASLDPRGTIGRNSGGMKSHVMDRGGSRKSSIQLDPSKLYSKGSAQLVRSLTLNSIYSFDILQYSNGL
jgi:hypothetical protein